MVKKNSGSQKNLGSKRFWVPKNCGSWNIESWKFMGYEKIKKKLGPKNCVSQKYCVLKIFGLEKIWVSKKFWSQKILSPKKFWSQKIRCVFLFLLFFFFFLWHWKTRSIPTSSSSVEFQVGLEFDKVPKINWIWKNFGSRNLGLGNFWNVKNCGSQIVEVQ